jgi:Domain of unknown function (DUF4424)
MRTIAATTLATILALVPVRGEANDSSAELSAGSIELVPNWDIVIDREDLYLAPDLVGVRYIFRNTSDSPVAILVAFPLPDIDMSELFEVPVDIPEPNNDNFVDFELAVNGEPVEVLVDQRASSLGVDRTELLAEHAIPLNPFSKDTHVALEMIDPETRAEFERLGIGHAYEPHEPLMPFWTLHTVFYWEQEFLPQTETVIEHRYRPVVGSGFFGTYVFDTEDPEDYVGRYCIDSSTQSGIRNRIADSGGDYLIEHRLSYILSTARNWQGPIGTFHLVIDKLDPSWLVSVCRDGLAKTSPTRFEFLASDYLPDQDLEILFLEPPPQ